MTGEYSSNIPVEIPETGLLRVDPRGGSVVWSEEFLGHPIHWKSILRFSHLDDFSSRIDSAETVGSECMGILPYSKTKETRRDGSRRSALPAVARSFSAAIWAARAARILDSCSWMTTSLADSDSVIKDGFHLFLTYLFMPQHAPHTVQLIHVGSCIHCGLKLTKSLEYLLNS